MKPIKFYDYPDGLEHLFYTEIFERFSFFGLNAIALLYLTNHVGLTSSDSLIITGTYITYAYLLTAVGGYLADRVFGRFGVIQLGAIFSLVGQILLTLSFLNVSLFYLGLAFVSTGTGLFKPSISLMVGKMFKNEDEQVKTEGLNVFYFGINIGAFLGPVIIGFLAQKINWHLGFGISAVAMFISLIVFRDGNNYMFKFYNDENMWSNDKLSKLTIFFRVRTWLYIALVVLTFIFALTLKYPISSEYLVGACFIGMLIYIISFWRNLKTSEKRGIKLILILSLFSLAYWSLGNQIIFSIPLLLDKNVNSTILGFNIPASSFLGGYNFLLIIFGLFINLFWKKIGSKNYNPSFAEKFFYGLIATSIAFLIMCIAFSFTPSNEKMSILWVLSFYVFIAFGELFISPCGLAMVSSYAPNSKAGTMMGLWWMINAFAGYIAAFIGKSIGFEKIKYLSFPEQMKVYQIGFFHISITIVAITIILFFIKSKLQYKHERS